MNKIYCDQSNGLCSVCQENAECCYHLGPLHIYLCDNCRETLTVALIDHSCGKPMRYDGGFERMQKELQNEKAIVLADDGVNRAVTVHQTADGLRYELIVYDSVVAPQRITVKRQTIFNAYSESEGERKFKEVTARDYDLSVFCF